jgi:anti-sigma factor RsiW
MSHPGELLSAYLDGELTPAERRAVHVHLAECEECRIDLGDLDAARTAVRALPLLDPPVPVVVAIGEAPAHRRRRAGVVIAAAAAVLVVGVVLMRDAPAEPAVDFASVMEQHSARVSVEPGVPAFRVVSVVQEP